MISLGKIKYETVAQSATATNIDIGDLFFDTDTNELFVKIS